MMDLKPIISMPDRREAYYLLVDEFLRGSEELRSYIVAKWDFGVSWEYPDQARLACTKGEPRTCEERIVASLAYDAIAANHPVDLRDTLVAFAVIYNSCIAANVNPNDVFRRVASVSGSTVGREMIKFLDRREEDKNLAAFMLVARKNEEGELEIMPNWSTRTDTDRS